MNYVKLKDPEQQEVERKSEIDKVLALFKHVLDLKDDNGHYYKFTDGRWIVVANHCVLSLDAGIGVLSESFSRTATPQEITSLMVSLIERSEEIFRLRKEAVKLIEKEIYNEWKRLKAQEKES